MKSSLNDIISQFNQDIAFLSQEISRLLQSFIYFMVITWLH